MTACKLKDVDPGKMKSKSKNTCKFVVILTLYFTMFLLRNKDLRGSLLEIKKIKTEFFFYFKQEFTFYK